MGSTIRHCNIIDNAHVKYYWIMLLYFANITHKGIFHINWPNVTVKNCVEYDPPTCSCTLVPIVYLNPADPLICLVNFKSSTGVD